MGCAVRLLVARSGAFTGRESYKTPSFSWFSVLSSEGWLVANRTQTRASQPSIHRIVLWTRSPRFEAHALRNGAIPICVGPDTVTPRPLRRGHLPTAILSRLQSRSQGPLPRTRRRLLPEGRLPQGHRLPQGRPSRKS